MFFHTIVLAALATTTFSALTTNYYDYTYLNALSTIRSVVKAAVQRENRMGASLLRLHFHDCFVNLLSISRYVHNFKISSFFFPMDFDIKIFN
ncbi:peroxidase family protein [Medicago truncatula]|uniref:peroxidase n=1 Tax=Medicago truncatula TaxID=3880 RepID=G7J369_MEDTR|nr:peroxidase family protein [Medicago truncatula]